MAIFLVDRKKINHKLRFLEICDCSAVLRHIGRSPLDCLSRLCVVLKKCEEFLRRKTGIATVERHSHPTEASYSAVWKIPAKTSGDL